MFAIYPVRYSQVLGKHAPYHLSSLRDSLIYKIIISWGIVSGMREIIPETNNPALREIAREIPVADITGTHIQSVIADMKALLGNEDNGVALAASQVGEPIRLFIVSGRALARGSRNAPDEPDAEDEHLPILPDQVYINPEILKMSRGSKDKHEGCLSIRGYWGMVPRAEKATIRAYDEHGKVFSRGAAGFLAHIFQHEMDHLNGILYTDKATEVYEDPDADAPHRNGAGKLKEDKRL